ncbi:MAG: thioesterase family protein [Sulfitobacter sp.]
MRFEYTQKVLFKHCDPAGIVFYPRYFEMVNDCVEAFFYEIGLPFEDIHKTHAVPTAEISTTFHNPSRHGETLIIAVEVSRIGGASLSLSFDATCGDTSKFSATSTLVYVDGTGRPQKWSDPARDAFSPYLRSST